MHALRQNAALDAAVFGCSCALRINTLANMSEASSDFYAEINRRIDEVAEEAEEGRITPITEIYLDDIKDSMGRS